jgi:hypothetical protein
MFSVLVCIFVNFFFVGKYFQQLALVIVRQYIMHMKNPWEGYLLEVD